MLTTSNTPAFTLSQVWRRVYEYICGKHPGLYPWHFQWLAAHYFYCRLKKLIPSFHGRVLDVGCGEKPYRSWFNKEVEYIGLDVIPGANVDVVVLPDECWPYPDEYFDVVFSSQVLDDVEYLSHTSFEMKRVLKKDGLAVLTIPFIYNENKDYHRFSVFGAQKLFTNFEIVHLEKLGGIGSTLTMLFLNWCSHFRFLKALLPLWIVFSIVLSSVRLTYEFPCQY